MKQPNEVPQEEEAMPQEQGTPQEETMPQEQGMPQEDTEEIKIPKASPELQRQGDAYITALSHLLHSKETAGSVLEMLRSAGDTAQKSVPYTALAVNKQMEEPARAKGKPPALEVLLAAFQFLVGDLIQIGNAAGLFHVESQEEIGAILKETLQTYITEGIHNGTVDPVELQEKAEPFMDKEHRELGMRAAKMTGTPDRPDQNTAMQAYGAQQKRAGMLKGGKQ